MACKKERSGYSSGATARDFFNRPFPAPLTVVQRRLCVCATAQLSGSAGPFGALPLRWAWRGESMGTYMCVLEAVGGAHGLATLPVLAPAPRGAARWQRSGVSRNRAVFRPHRCAPSCGVAWSMIVGQSALSRSRVVNRPCDHHLATLWPRAGGIRQPESNVPLFLLEVVAQDRRIGEGDRGAGFHGAPSRSWQCGLQLPALGCFAGRSCPGRQSRSSSG